MKGNVCCILVKDTYALLFKYCPITWYYFWLSSLKTIWDVQKWIWVMFLCWVDSSCRSWRKSWRFYSHVAIFFKRLFNVSWNRLLKIKAQWLPKLRYFHQLIQDESAQKKMTHRRVVKATNNSATKLFQHWKIYRCLLEVGLVWYSDLLQILLCFRINKNITSHYQTTYSDVDNISSCLH